MNRRDFIRRGANKVAESVTKEVDERANRQAHRWIRPPHSIEELEFLLTCTRCGDCIEACPHEAIFPLGAHLGAQVVGTPAMDLVNRGCHLCEDWPCIKACGPKVLERTDGAALPRLARVEVDPEHCLPYQGPECGACRGSCPVPGALIWDRERPSIDLNACVGCALCREACILTPKAIVVRSFNGAADSRSAES